jgi:hypothetical protein
MNIASNTPTEKMIFPTFPIFLFGYFTSSSYPAYFFYLCTRNPDMERVLLKCVSDAWEAVQADLQGTVLGFSSLIDAKVLKCYIDVTQCTVEECECKGRFTGTTAESEQEKPGLRITGSNISYELATSNEEDRKIWVDRLRMPTVAGPQKDGGASDVIAQLRAKYAEQVSKSSKMHQSSGVALVSSRVTPTHVHKHIHTHIHIHTHTHAYAYIYIYVYIYIYTHTHTCIYTHTHTYTQTTTHIHTHSLRTL